MKTLSLKRKTTEPGLDLQGFDPKKPVVCIQKASGGLVLINLVGVLRGEVTELFNSGRLNSLCAAYGIVVGVSTDAEPWTNLTIEQTVQIPWKGFLLNEHQCASTVWYTINQKVTENHGTTRKSPHRNPVDTAPAVRHRGGHSKGDEWQSELCAGASRLRGRTDRKRR